MKVPELKNSDFSAECISHPALKGIMKFRNHSSVSAIRNAFNRQSFNFSKITVDDVLKEINKLGDRKAMESTEIPILKHNAGVFGGYNCHFFNVCVDKGTFPFALKHANITSVFRNGHKSSKENYRPVSILPVISKIFEKLFTVKKHHSWISFCLSTNVGFERDSMLSITFLACWRMEESS